MKQFCCRFLSILQAIYSGSALRWSLRNLVKIMFVGLVAVSVVVLAGLLTSPHRVTLDILQTSTVIHKRNDPVNTIDKRNQTWDVIVSTYMRSGSTFLGEMFGHRNDSFYWYEPLWRNFTWKFHREDGKLCDYLKPSCGNDTVYAKKALDTALQFLSDVYNCRLAAHTNRIVEYLHTTSIYAGPSWEAYRMCRSKSGRTSNSSSFCLSSLEPVCRNATHRVTKVLRLDFSYIETLLKDNPRLKAILLLRDPRGILNSHIYTDWFPMKRNNTSALAKDAEVMCSRMDRDIKTAKLLLSIYPSRVKIVQYEDFDDPVRKVKMLYSFLNMHAGQFPLKLVSKEARGANSSRHKSRGMFSYRTTLDWVTVQMLDSHCRNVYRELGLVQYKDEKHLRNIAQSPIINTLPYSLEIR